MPTRLIGPNCPGVITPGEAKVGIMPGFVFKKGTVGIVSKSGTLTYEAADQVVRQGLGITTAIGIGGDPIIGTTTKEAVELLINDPETEAVVMIGEIGGQLEADAAKWYKESGSKKPIIGFIAGETAPAGRTMGHAGAIVGGSDDTAQAKKSHYEGFWDSRSRFSCRNWKESKRSSWIIFIPSYIKSRFLRDFFWAKLGTSIIFTTIYLIHYHEIIRKQNSHHYWC